MEYHQRSLGNVDTSKSNVTTIFFIGFGSNATINMCLFFALLLTYCVTLCENFLIIMLVSYSKTLHSPMYFFLTQLSASDIILTTDIVPNGLNVVLNNRPSISLPSCIIQLYVFSTSVTFECFILMVMSYDRYLAICCPLRYASIMSRMLCMKLVFVFWLLSCSITLMFMLSISQLQFCGANTIDHFFCDLDPLLKLSCSDISMVLIEVSLMCIPDVVLPFLVTVVSYVYIVLTIIKIPSYSGKLKSFSTCSSHLTVVSMYYGTLTVMYMLPNGGQSQISNKMIAMLYTVLIPFLNPLIYSLKNKDIKEALRHIVCNQRAYY